MSVATVKPEPIERDAGIRFLVDLPRAGFDRSVNVLRGEAGVYRERWGRNGDWHVCDAFRNGEPHPILVRGEHFRVLS